MKSFYLITNEVKDPALQYTDRVISFLQKQEGCKVVRSGCSGGGSLHTDMTQIPGDTDCVLVLGGDGTLFAGGQRSVYGRYSLDRKQSVKCRISGRDRSVSYGRSLVKVNTG